MFLKSYSLFVVLALLLCIVGSANEKVAVAIIDGPLDLNAPQLQSAVDLEFLKSISVGLEDRSVVSILDWNQKILELYKSTMGVGRLDLVQNYYKTSVHKRIWNPWLLRSMLFYLSELSHGTSVAGAVLYATDSVRLVPIPVLGPSKTHLSRAVIKNFNEGELRDRLYKRVSRISEVLRASGARIAVMSFSLSEETNLNVIRDMPFYSKIFLGDRIGVYARRSAVIFREAIESLILKNPDVLFVQAAGNLGSDLSIKIASGLVSTHSIKASNLLNVASTDSFGVISPFSNYSSEYVDIAARGEMVSLPLFGGIQTFISGTSVAAPFVAGQLAEIFSKYPEFTTQQAISHLYSNSVERDYNLRNYVKEGRKLISCRQLLTRL